MPNIPLDPQDLIGTRRDFLKKCLAPAVTGGTAYGFTDMVLKETTNMAARTRQSVSLRAGAGVGYWVHEVHTNAGKSIRKL